MQGWCLNLTFITCLNKEPVYAGASAASFWCVGAPAGSGKQTCSFTVIMRRLFKIKESLNQLFCERVDFDFVSRPGFYLAG